MRFCRECGSKLFYDRNLKEYVCRSCGLTYSFQDLIVEAEKNTVENRSKRDEKKIRKEYLEWWLSKK
ncbi:MAG: hypothetical protein ABDH32_01665 [Candidatus Caldarchaeales archaeon]